MSTSNASEEATQRNIAARRLFDDLMRDVSSTHFKVLPDPFLYPSYYAVITRPICLADISNSIQAGKYTLDDMQRDLRRMIGNAKKYNMPESIVYQDALQLEVSRARANHLRTTTCS
jgi:predicted YcjX-like family ATPase